MKKYQSGCLAILGISFVFVSITVACVFLLWQRQIAKEEEAIREAEALVESLGGSLHRLVRRDEIEVHLDGTELDDQDLERLVPYLKALPRFVRLRLISTDISDQAVEHLRKLKSLLWIDLSDTAVTEKGVRSLSASLPMCRIRYGTKLYSELWPSSPERQSTD